MSNLPSLARLLYSKSMKIKELIQKEYMSGLTPADVYKYAQTSCAHPVRIRSNSPLMKLGGSIYLPCGHCQQCLLDKQTDFVSRAYLHSFSYKHIYFLTTGFRSPREDAHLDPTCPDNILFQKFPYLYWDLNTNNTHHKLEWSPTMLSKVPLQNFLKRLRKKLNDPTMSYYACGEYGHKYGRPHYHLMLWSNEEITPAIVQDALSFKYKIKDNQIVIGRNGCTDSYCIDPKFDLVDLIANGTYLSRGSGTKNSYKNTLAYVAKYCQKNDKVNWTMFDKGYARYEQGEDLFDHNILTKYHAYEEFTHTDEFRHLESLKEFYGMSPQLPYWLVRKLHSPFVLQSTSKAIGKEYFIANLERFLSGNTNLPQADFSLSFPRYYSRLLKQARFPYRCKATAESGFTKTMDVEELHAKVLSKSMRVPARSVTNSLSLVFNGPNSFQFEIKDLNRQITYRLAAPTCNMHDLLFIGSRFNRSTRSWDDCCIVPYTDMVGNIRAATLDYCRVYSQLYQESLKQALEFMKIKDKYDFFEDTFTNCLTDKNTAYEYRQKIYHADHESRCYA